MNDFQRDFPKDCLRNPRVISEGIVEKMPGESHGEYQGEFQEKI